LIHARGLQLAYPCAGDTVQALQDLDLDIPPGQYVILLGPSGSGKTSLLNLLGGLEHPSGGTLRVGNLDMRTASDATLARFRNHQVGFVFQSFHLDERRTALENVLVPLYFGEAPLAQGRRRAGDLLTRVGLEGMLDRPVSRLSGGQRQRVAVARALVCEPDLLLADEPVGHLDDTTADAVMDLLVELHRERGLTLVASTHENRLLRHAERVLELKAGMLVADRLLTEAC